MVRAARSHPAGQPQPSLPRADTFIHITVHNTESVVQKAELVGQWVLCFVSWPECASYAVFFSWKMQHSVESGVMLLTLEENLLLGWYLASHSVEGYDTVSDWLFLGGLAWNITRPLHERGIVVWYC